MGKAASPVRFEKELLESAALSGQVNHRSAVGQIEYWATIGRMVDDILDPDTLLAINSGFKRLTVEPAKPVTVNADQLFEQIEQQRQQGTATHPIAAGTVAYQRSDSHPGMLEQVQSNGDLIVGSFENGEFKPADPAA
ncbi:MAG: hypothetical protein JKY89_12510 [Immundisolibacteraceae bacterium]|nr:hypothetical protein [Immundisolibacteraceae bacterium]